MPISQTPSALQFSTYPSSSATTAVAAVLAAQTGSVYLSPILDNTHDRRLLGYPGRPPVPYSDQENVKQRMGHFQWPGRGSMRPICRHIHRGITDPQGGGSTRCASAASARPRPSRAHHATSHERNPYAFNVDFWYLGQPRTPGAPMVIDASRASNVSVSYFHHRITHVPTVHPVSQSFL